MAQWAPDKWEISQQGYGETDLAPRTVYGPRSGHWGIHTAFDDATRTNVFVLDHIPTGHKAGYSDSEETLHKVADMIDSFGDFSQGKPAIEGGEEAWSEKFAEAMPKHGIYHLGGGRWSEQQ